MMNKFVLQELLGEELPFRVHNVKIGTLMCEKDLPTMFLAHYDRLSDEDKQACPLSVDLLKCMNDKMTTNEACALLGLPNGAIKPALHVKIIGTAVIVLDDFPLALHLSFTNTAKDSQTVYSDGDRQTLIQQEAKKCQFTGNVSVLHKNTSKHLVSVDLHGDEFVIATFDSYTRLPNSHALAVTHTLNTLKDNQPQTLDYVMTAIENKIISYG
ncbi:MAG: hypothetical protein Q4G13_01205 [Moraxella sp.]|nr:hypothetical protein [Moraxella sp.]